MFKTLRMVTVAIVTLLMLAPPALAQTTLIKGKVVDSEGKPVQGAQVSIEFKGGVARKYQTKTDRRGEFVQLLTESGIYLVSVNAEKAGSAQSDVQVRLGQPANVEIKLSPGGAGADGAKAAEVKKMFEEGVAASKAGDHDTAIARFTAASEILPNCYDCFYNIGVSHMAKKDEKQKKAPKDKQ